MAESVTWEEAKQRYPDEWVAFANYQAGEAIAVNGIVIAHHRDKQTLHTAVRRFMPLYGDIAVRYTGRLVKNSEIPLLWQIFDTN